MKRILILLLIMQGCSTSKTSTKQAEQTKTEIKEVVTYNDSSKITTIRETEYIHFYDTITKKVYIYPKLVKENISENKVIQATQNKETIQSTKTEVKSVDKRKISILESPKFWLYFAGFLLLLYFILKFAKKIRLL